MILHKINHKNIDALNVNERSKQNQFIETQSKKDKTNRISNEEKDELISFSTKESGLGLFNLILALLILFLILSVFIPKIYLSNNIYYTSRDIAKLQAEKDLLYEEKRKLQRSIQTINNGHLLLEIGE